MLLRLEELEKRLNEIELGEGEQPEGLPVGSEAPAFELPDLADCRRTLEEFRGQPLLLIFFNPACGFCRDLAPKLAEFSPHLPPCPAEASVQRRGMEERAGQPSVGLAKEGVSRPINSKPLILVVSTGDAETNRQLFNDHQLTCPVLLQKEMEVAAAYKANGTPSGYLISPEGKIASDLAIGADALLSLASGHGSQLSTINLQPEVSGNGHGRDDRFSNHSLARSRIKRDGLKAGTAAPDFRLPRLDGRGELSLENLRGQRVLLVFSSPHCGPCDTLAPELEKFHRAHPDLEVVMISKGEPRENREKVKEHELTFPIVLQQQWEISRRYAMFATPVAYLIDEAGIIVRNVAVGTEAIQTLFT